MRDTPTLPDVLEQLQRLSSALGKPYDVEEDGAGEGFLHALKWRGVPMSAAVAAVDEWIATMDRWPKPAQLAAMAKKHTPKTDGERNAAPEFSGDRCFVCDATWFFAGWQLGEVVYPRMRCRCPSDALGWWTDQALAWEEPDPRVPSFARKPRDYATNGAYRYRGSTRPHVQPRAERTQPTKARAEDVLPLGVA